MVIMMIIIRPFSRPFERPFAYGLGLGPLLHVKHGNSNMAIKINFALIFGSSVVKEPSKGAFTGLQGV